MTKLSKQAEQQREQMARALHRRPHADTAAAGAGDDDQPAAPAAASRPRLPRVKPVRITVDLAPDLHRRLKVWAVEADDARLADVVRVLTERMLDDDELADAVRAELQTRQAR